MSEPAPARSSPALDDEALERILHEREEQEQKDVLALAKAGLAVDAPCPVCGKPLEAQELSGFLRPFAARPPLACEKCSFAAGPPPNALGEWVLIPIVTLCFAYAGILQIFAAQRLADERGQMVTFLQGFALFGVALMVWYSGKGAASAKQLQQRILRHRRRWEDEQDGVTAPETTSLLGENLEAVVVAVILALIIRHFVMEAFVIPTGSMAPTLLGDHFQVSCERCKFRFDVSKRETELTGDETSKEITATCPLCDYTWSLEEHRSDVRGGDKILVNKFIYRFRPPRRYEVVVFKFPNTPWRNYIKRLVGLPGEKIRIKNGDVFADGQRARKPDSVQDSIWIPVHDSAHERSAGEPRWDVVDPGQRAAWTFGEGGQSDLDGQLMRCDPTKAAGDPSWVSYVGRDIRTSYGYNREDGSRGEPIADLRVRTLVTGEAGAVVRLAILEQTRVYDEASNSSHDVDRVVAARFGFGPGGYEFAVEVDGAVQHAQQLPALAPGTSHELTLAYADDRARLQVDGRTILAWDDPFGPEQQTYRAAPRLAAAGAPVTFRHLRIDRDIHYVDSGSGRWDPSHDDVEVPARSYFVMGDNSPNSEDGRKWGFVREGHMIGRAFLVFWPPTLDHLALIR
ncbi:MAG: signal peptidase I [Planctomycetota bacterium]